ncbi:MAG: 30S ribosomal protein S12 methylthiotransferase RimO [Candidatus Riflebacteria bacterium]|nr:30S ribosomal protein S12 methylthiotransferase RimO [Candidatus Riflebacteria bacterium]
MKFHIISLGCTKNTADSEKIANIFAQSGFTWVNNPQESDLLLINTCGFINDAKEQSLSVIMESVSLKDNLPSGKALKIAVFGCLVKRYYNEIKSQIPEIDYLFDFFNEKNLKELISLNKQNDASCFNPARFFTPPHIGILKIAEGCDNRCSYCAIPNIRGPFVSLDEKSILDNAQELAESGAKELSVVAQDITRYGTDKGKECSLPSLVKKLSKIKGIEWIRLHYMHPRGLTVKLINELYSIDKVVPYFDIPLQHVSPKLIEAMNRHTTLEHMIEILSHIRSAYPSGAIRTTFIVGFPSETPSDFNKLINFIEEYPLDRVGAFMYSPEEGTPAFNFSRKVSPKVKQSRLDRLMTLQQLIIEEQNKKLIGQTLDVIVDSVENGSAKCRTKFDAYEVDNSTTIHKCDSLKPGQIVKVKIVHADAYDFTAELIV